jgi:hypothetical protein
MYDKERVLIEEEIRRVEAADITELERRKREDWL